MAKNERLAVIVQFNSNGEESSVSAIAFGQEEAHTKKARMIADLRAQGKKPFDSEIVEDTPRPHRKPRPSNNS